MIKKEILNLMYKFTGVFLDVEKHMMQKNIVKIFTWFLNLDQMVNYGLLKEIKTWPWLSE